MKQSLFIFALLISTSSFGQNEYSKLLYNSQAEMYSHALVNSSENGVLLAGTNYNNGLAIKLDDSGSEIWTTAFQGFFQFHDVIATSDSSFLMTGVSNNSSLSVQTACGF